MSINPQGKGSEHGLKRAEMFLEVCIARARCILRHRASCSLLPWYRLTEIGAAALLLVVVASDDGMVGYVFTHLSDRSVPIGVLPLGAANNIARSLGIAGTPQELAEQWRMNNVRPFNLIAVDGRKDEYLCAEGFGVGLIPALIKRRAKQKRADGPENLRRGRQVLREIVGVAGAARC